MATVEPNQPSRLTAAEERRSALFYVLLAAVLLVFIETFALLFALVVTGFGRPSPFLG